MLIEITSRDVGTSFDLIVREDILYCPVCNEPSDVPGKIRSCKCKSLESSAALYLLEEKFIKDHKLKLADPVLKFSNPNNRDEVVCIFTSNTVFLYAHDKDQAISIFNQALEHNSFGISYMLSNILAAVQALTNKHSLLVAETFDEGI
jgi:hypothetical protein